LKGAIRLQKAGNGTAQVHGKVLFGYLLPARAKLDQAFQLNCGRSSGETEGASALIGWYQKPSWIG
jgi:hypothetical protein